MQFIEHRTTLMNCSLYRVVMPLSNYSISFIVDPILIHNTQDFIRKLEENENTSMCVSVYKNIYTMIGHHDHVFYIHSYNKILDFTTLKFDIKINEITKPIIIKYISDLGDYCIQKIMDK